ncbi:MAG: GNAT family N-acetyltransferase [Cyanobacteriota bacterium]|jgi:N-acetylglutamate synthase-like GNAT family acetyltransferase
MDCCSFRFSLDAQDIDLVQLQALLNLTASWAQNRSLEDLQRALAHSYPVAGLWREDQLIGFGRATSDGVYRAMLWDVVIHPQYQGAGLGRRLLQTLLDHPHLAGVERVYLTTTQGKGFYERLGFEENPSATLVWRRQPGESQLRCQGSLQKTL